MLINAALLASLNVTRSQFEARMAEMAALCSHSDKHTLAACVRLYAFQTTHEKAVDRTVMDNDVGFQEMDAKFGGRMARVILAGHVVWPQHMPRLRRMAVKYRRQIAYLSFRKEQAKARMIEEQESRREAHKDAMAA